MKTVSFFCPASISLLFKVCPNNDLVKMGSVGVGFTVDRRVEVSIQQSGKTSIWFNNKPIIFPTVTSVINSLTKEPVTVNIKSSLPLGFGFGVSSASALAVAFALNKFFSLNKSENELIKLAHIAEILNKTGLGSVGTQVTGGFLLKISPGVPVSFKKFPFAGKKIYAAIIDKLETPTILNSPIKIQKNNQAADAIMQTINKLASPSLEQFIDLSYQSVKMSGLISNPIVSRIIEEIRSAGGFATMARLGNVVISNIKPKTNYRIEEMMITDKGFLK